MSVTLPQSIDSVEECHSDDYCIVVYNNDTNHFAEVIAILCIALNISQERAEMHAWDIHLLGSSRVYYGSHEFFTLKSHNNLTVRSTINLYDDFQPLTKEKNNETQ